MEAPRHRACRCRPPGSRPPTPRTAWSRTGGCRDRRRPGHGRGGCRPPDRCRGPAPRSAPFLPHLAHRRCRRWAGPAPDRSGGPPTTRGLLTLRVLRSAPGLAEAVLLALDPPGVAGEQARLLEGVTQVGIELDQPAGDTESK